MKHVNKIAFWEAPRKVKAFDPIQSKIVDGIDSGIMIHVVELEEGESISSLPYFAAAALEETSMVRLSIPNTDLVVIATRHIVIEEVVNESA